MSRELAETIRKFISYIFSFGAITALAYFGERGSDGGVMKDVWAAAKSASPFAAMLCLLLLFDQIKERRSAQKECSDRTIDFIKTINLVNRAIDKMAVAVERRKK